MIPFTFFNSPGKTYPGVKAFFEAVRSNEGSSLPVGAAGFCWGGKHTVLLSMEPDVAGVKPLIDAGFTGHPSMLEIPVEIEKIRKPISFAIGEFDIAVKTPHIEQIKVVVDKQEEAYKGEVKVYPGAGHGFCVRADHILKESASQASEAEDQCIEWFNKHFRDVKY